MIVTTAPSTPSLAHTPALESTTGLSSLKPSLKRQRPSTAPAVVEVVSPTETAQPPKPPAFGARSVRFATSPSTRASSPSPLVPRNAKSLGGLGILHLDTTPADEHGRQMPPLDHRGSFASTYEETPNGDSGIPALSFSQLTLDDVKIQTPVDEFTPAVTPVQSKGLRRLTIGSRY